MFEEYSKDKLTKKQVYVSTFTLLLILLFFALFNTNTEIYSGTGSISVFPHNSISKNYRLDNVEIEVTDLRRGWFKHNYSYSISTAVWPNGDILEFNTICKIIYPKTTADCNSNSGVYSVEVTAKPEPPMTSD